MEEKKTAKKEIARKEFAIVNGTCRISTKASMSICDMIKGKSPETAIALLEKVIMKKWAVPMNNREVGHRHLIMAGRYPVEASKEFINLLKQLIANASVNGVENLVITKGIANIASRPFKRGGRQAKRTNLLLEVRDRTKLQKLAKK